jgi:pentatricopeptide repeat protein
MHPPTGLSSAFAASATVIPLAFRRTRRPFCCPVTAVTDSTRGKGGGSGRANYSTSGKGTKTHHNQNLRAVPFQGKRKRMTARDAVILSSRLRKSGRLHDAAGVLRSFKPPQSASTAILNEYIYVRIAEARVGETRSAALESDELYRPEFTELPPQPIQPLLDTFEAMLSVVRSSPAVPNSRTFNALLCALRTENAKYAAASLKRAIALVEKDMAEQCIEPDSFTMVILFQMCGVAGDADAALALRDSAGDSLDIISGTALISAFAKIGDVQQSEAEFNALVARGLLANERTYAAIISAYHRAGLHTKVLAAMNDAIASPNVCLNFYVFSGALGSCAKTGDSANARRYFNCMLENGITPNADAIDSVLDAAVRGGDVALAMCVLYEWLPRCRSKAQYDQVTKVISMCGRVGAKAGGGKDRVLHLLRTMQTEFGLNPNIATLNAAILAIGRSKDLKAARRVFEVEFAAAGLTANIATYNALILACSAVDNIDASFEFLSALTDPVSLVRPNQVTYNIILEQSARANDTKRVSAIMREMIMTPGIVFGSASISSLLLLYRNQGNPAAALAIVREHVRGNSIEETPTSKVAKLSKVMTSTMTTEPLDTTIYNSLMTICFENGKEADAIGFAGMLFVTSQLNVGTYNVLIAYIGQELNDPVRASRMLANMKQRGIAPDDVTYSTLIRACAQAGTLELAYRLLGEMQDVGLGGADTYAWTTLIDGFGRAGQWQRAVELLECMRYGNGFRDNTDQGVGNCSALAYGLIPAPSTASYNAALYAAGMGGGGWNFSQRIYEWLCADPNVTPDKVTYSAMASVILENRREVRDLHLVGDIVDKLREARWELTSENDRRLSPSEVRTLKKIDSKISRMNHVWGGALEWRQDKQ